MPTSVKTLALMLVLVVAVGGCASARRASLRNEIRKAAPQPVAEAPGDVSDVFSELARAAGLDAMRVYVAVWPNVALNAGSVGDHHFFVTTEAVELNDRCFLTGLVAHELAHDILKHATWATTVSDVTSTVTAVIGTAAGVVVPGAGYLVQGAASLGVKAYSRSQESDADAVAVKVLRAAGKPAWSLRYTLERLRQQSGTDGGGWLSTHPATAERITSQPSMDTAEVRAACGWAPGDPPAPPSWCRGLRDRFDPDTKSCYTNEASVPDDPTSPPFWCVGQRDRFDTATRTCHINDAAE